MSSRLISEIKRCNTLEELKRLRLDVVKTRPPHYSLLSKSLEQRMYDKMKNKLESENNSTTNRNR